ncbi:saccharopine dehydrogenase NADP-binding domain-containing protein [Gracilibacillus massiliensis]|uniref:saccharopine dehydrogenase NADP-binding domain-containing protein n=1 Tax=Gracilibacillus massiliensis TaxID=1564956 RepID=UPI00071D0493|nr:saccharopine dehydrogenase NADP-binding domain-containing protein [Gracilibacillus massiliensis]
MRDKIIVIGGYGNVGSIITQRLAKVFAGKVYAAGRSKAKAEKFAQETNNKVKPLVFSMKQAISEDWFSEIKLVIVCIDQQDTTFMEQCLKNGVAYVDITANRHFLTMANKFNNDTFTAPAILSVGFIPGISNLLASRIQQQYPTIHRLDIDVLLGLGDEHGEAALQWMLMQTYRPFTIYQNGQKIKKTPFSDKKATFFDGNSTKHYTYRFPFPDQQTLYQTLEVPTISTRVCFDSSIMTTALYWLCKSRMNQLLKIPLLNKLFLTFLKNWKYGSKQCIVKVEGLDTNGSNHLTFSSEEEATVTANVATCVAQALIENNFEHKIYHIEEIFSLTQNADQLHLQVTKTKKSYKLDKGSIDVI